MGKFRSRCILFLTYLLSTANVDLVSISPTTQDPFNGFTFNTTSVVNQGKHLSSNMTSTKSSGSGFLFTRTSVSIKFAFFIVLFIVGTIGNGFMLYVIWKTPQLRSRTNILLAWLTVADITTGFTLTLYVGIYQFLAFVVTNSPCDYIRVSAASFTMAAVGLQTAISMIIAIAIERYVAIVHPFRYMTWITDRWAKITVGICWGVGVGHALKNAIYLYNVDFASCALPYSLVMRCVSDVGMYLTASVTMLVLYGCILKVALKQRSKLDLMPSTSNHGCDRSKKFRIELKAAKTTAMILGSMIVLWFPLMVGRFLQGIGDTRLYTQYFVDVGLSVGLVNPAINWFIYGVSSQAFRNAMMRTMKFKQEDDST